MSTSAQSGASTNAATVYWTNEGANFGRTIANRTDVSPAMRSASFRSAMKRTLETLPDACRVTFHRAAVQAFEDTMKLHIEQAKVGRQQQISKPKQSSSAGSSGTSS